MTQIEIINQQEKLNQIESMYQEYMATETPVEEERSVIFAPQNTAIDTHHSKSAEKVASLAEDDSKILDYGCGTGRNIRFIRYNSDATRIDGTDIPEQLEKESEKLNKLDNIYRTEILQLTEVSNDFYDLVLSSHVLNVIESDEMKKFVIQDIYNKLDKGGKAVIEVRTKSDIESAKTKEPHGEGWKIKKGNSFTYQEAITKEKMKHLVTSVGFEIEEHIFNSSRHMVTVAK